MDETIFALATAPGRAGVAVVRISGSLAFEIVESYVTSVPLARGLRRVQSRNGELIDQALVLRFEAPHSFTGENVIELHLHGSPAIVARLMQEFESDPRLRPAVAGEFTRRALDNGRLDLAQVEGLADLIDAETESQRRQAVRVFDGALGQLAEKWRSDLIHARALIEATIDFADEDVPEDVTPEVEQTLNRVAGALRAEIEGSRVSERIRDGFVVAIVGPPNAGKSSLLNRLAGREAAITSDIAGTTRDIIEVRMDLDGLPVTFLDTAGLRESQDKVESIGIARAVERAKAADLRVFLDDGTHLTDLTPDQNDLVVRPKSDLDPDADFSAQTGDGVDQLVDRIVSQLSRLAAGSGIAIRARHRQAMQESLEEVQAALSGLQGDLELDLVAENLRHATSSIDMIVGRVDVEDLLDTIFASFCIGK